ncbi:uncharacterized protein KIAA1143 homolog [Argiope bruennichi]|uniref:uncharacterized protein KIAA1143 homolog n=1 Tax=Argiope bruennichi TaxID=94029 RepID=UPI00249566BA|nr:uncharacterized protein KIAA1143 homolog [Argiope bruennichi]
MSKRSISYTKPPEPSFIKKMKDAIGYQEPDTVETKREIRPFQDDDQEERDDEKPVIVVLNEGDLTEEQAKKITDKADLNKKITFAKPVKKDNEEKNSLDFSSKKKDDLQKKINIQKGKSESLKNTSLLSFGDEDEDEEDY